MASDNAPFPFMELPMAIRFMVYERIPRRILYDRLRIPTFGEALLVCRVTDTAILETSRQIRHEAMHFVQRTVDRYVLEQTPRLFVSDVAHNPVLRTIMHATRLQIQAIDAGNFGFQLPSLAMNNHFPEAQEDEQKFRQFIRTSVSQLMPHIRNYRRLRAAHQAQHAGNPNPPAFDAAIPGYQIVLLQNPGGYARSNDIWRAARAIGNSITAAGAVAPPEVSLSIAGAVPRIHLHHYGTFSPTTIPRMLPGGLPSHPVVSPLHITLLPEMSWEEWVVNWLD
ncbi:unnamed protein product [Periconia digitata]|uniref:Uncharacterized protein n=1 Tax=Periconia digitata TaxID=1303443 RepID=A0A9W4U0V0_9PLEO|nr:unnamed protein product [Periconia digitata]